MKNKVIVFCLLIIPFIFRLYYINKIELSPDECYYWEWSRNLDICYSDQGYVLGSLIFLSKTIFGSNEFGVRFPAVFCHFFTILIAYFLAKEVFKSITTAIFTLILFNVVPLSAIGGMFVTPDSPQVLFWSLCCYFGYKTITDERKVWWYFLGISLGLGIMSKYTMIFFLLPFFYLLKNNYKKREPYISLFIAFLFCLPALIWNLKNDFITLRYLSSPVVFKPFKSVNFLNLLNFLAGQGGIVSPFLFFLIPFCYRGNDWLFLNFLSVFGFFLFFSIFAKVEANWPVASYFSIFLLLAEFIKVKSIQAKSLIKSYLTFSLLFASFLTSISLLQTIYPFLPLKEGLDPSDEKLRGWRKLGEEISSAGFRTQPCLIISNYYWLASELAFYVEGQPKIYCVDVGFPLRGYALWSKEIPKENAIYVKADIEVEDEVKRKFKKVEFLKKIDIPLRTFRNKPIFKKIFVYNCRI